ncbi:hypothetical protein GCM10028822_23120 [Hymenobacter terrigena]
MKTTLIAVLLSGASLSAAWAQEPTEAEAVTIIHVKKGEEPQKVMSALQKDFPGSIVKDVSTIPGTLYGQEWSINEEKPAAGQANATYYQVNASSKGMAYTAVYDKNGNLLSSRKVLKNTALPIDAAKNVATQFPGWLIVGDQEKLTVHNQHDKVAYRVIIKKGQEEKKVFLDGDGHITRVVKKNRIRV